MSIWEKARRFLADLRVTKRLNTVDFVDVMDGIELVDAVEEFFGIKITDNEAESVITVGQLYDLVKGKPSSKPDLELGWETFLRFIRSQSDSKDDIDQDTTFFAEDAKPRT